MLLPTFESRIAERLNVVDGQAEGECLQSVYRIVEVLRQSGLPESGQDLCQSGGEIRISCILVQQQGERDVG